MYTIDQYIINLLWLRSLLRKEDAKGATAGRRPMPADTIVTLIIDFRMFSCLDLHMA